MHLILASTSPYRRDLLSRLGLPFEALAPACDEEALKDPALAPQALAERLAEAKARSLAGQYPEALIIGSDQVCHLDGVILHKPRTDDRAVAQLTRLAGRTHALVTAMCVLHPGGCERHTDVTTLHMRDLDSAALARYVARDRPLDCAGAYKLECSGIGLFSAIESADHSAIIGLPLIALTRILSGLGFAIP